MSFHVASSTSSVGVRLVLPAQLTRMSTLPNVAQRRVAQRLQRRAVGDVRRHAQRPPPGGLDRVSGRVDLGRAAAPTRRRPRPPPPCPRLMARPMPGRTAQHHGAATGQSHRRHCSGSGPAALRHHHMLADSDIMSLSGSQVMFSQRRVADADQRVRAVEPVRVLDDDLVGRQPVGAQDDARRHHRERVRQVLRVGIDAVEAARQRQPRQEAVRHLAAELPLGDAVVVAAVGVVLLVVAVDVRDHAEHADEQIGAVARKRHRVADQLADATDRIASRWWSGCRCRCCSVRGSSRSGPGRRACSAR